MKDSEFKELLNLYLDHEITAADAARLEAEVQGNPSRRRVYQDYCRMQKACKMLATDFATETVPAADNKVVAFETARATSQRSKVIYIGSGFAALAACVALVFVSRSHEQPAAPTAAAVAQATPVVSEPTQLVAAAPAPARGIIRRSADNLSLRNNADALALNASLQNDPHFSWMQDVRLNPLPAPTSSDQLQLQLTPAIHNENRTYTTGNKSLSSDVPGIAIRFQK